MGELHVILGPMFSGKTTRLIELSLNYSNPLFINYALDTRYHETLLSTHDGKNVPCIQTLHLQEITSTDNADAIFVNEAQFFTDLIPVIKKWVDHDNKKVYICGLDGDFRREPFGDFLHILSLCDTVEKLHAKCLCKKPAIFTRRLTDEQEQTLIGYKSYKSLCRECFTLFDRGHENH